MQFVRTIVESNRLEELVDIPGEFKNQKVEILILPLIEKQEKKKKTFNPDDFEGILNIDPEIIDREIKNMRDEWERI
jgi:hypothetical protein